MGSMLGNSLPGQPEGWIGFPAASDGAVHSRGNAAALLAILAEGAVRLREFGQSRMEHVTLAMVAMQTYGK
jgi:hypothetical protein